MTGDGRALAVACPEQAEARAAAGTGAELLARFPRRPACLSWPATEAGRQQVLARLLAAPFPLVNPLGQQNRRLGLVTMLNWLQAQPGGSWQGRWLASGAEGQPDWRDLAAAWKMTRPGKPDRPPGMPRHIGAGLMLLICGDVIRPGIGWLLGNAAAPAQSGRRDGPHP